MLTAARRSAAVIELRARSPHPPPRPPRRPQLPPPRGGRVSDLTPTGVIVERVLADLARRSLRGGPVTRRTGGRAR